MSEMITILLVDDHELVRTGLKQILESNPDLKVIAEARNGESAVNLAREISPDLVLMDINMPGMGGIEATRTIRRQNPDTRIIAVTVHEETPFPEKLHDAGALGYITKGCDAAEMFEAINTVMSDRPVVSRNVSKRLTLAHLTGLEPGSPFEELSQREVQVLMMITQGKKNQDISDQLCLSPKTVSTYRHRLYEKLGVETDVELTHLALRHGIIDAGG